MARPKKADRCNATAPVQGVAIYCQRKQGHVGEHSCGSTRWAS